MSIAARETPEPDRSRGAVFVDRYRTKLEEHIRLCSEAMDVTGTIGWRTVYASNMETHKHTEKASINRITGAVEVLRMSGSDEQTEKDIKEAVKMLAEERERHDAWVNRAVGPYERAVDQYRLLREQIFRDAKEREQQNTLIDRGLFDEVQKEMRTFPAAEWSDDTGTVVVA